MATERHIDVTVRFDGEDKVVDMLELNSGDDVSIRLSNSDSEEDMICKVGAEIFDWFNFINNDKEES